MGRHEKTAMNTQDEEKSTTYYFFFEILAKYLFVSIFLNCFTLIVIPFFFFAALFDVLMDEKDSTSTIFSFVMLGQFSFMFFVLCATVFPASLFLIYNISFCIKNWNGEDTTKKMKSKINEISIKLEKKVDELELQSKSENYEQIEDIAIISTDKVKEEVKYELNWENTGKYRFRGCYSIILFLCILIFPFLPITIITISILHIVRILKVKIVGIISFSILGLILCFGLFSFLIFICFCLKYKMILKPFIIWFKNEFNIIKN